MTLKRTQVVMLTTKKEAKISLFDKKLFLSPFVNWESKPKDWEKSDGINQHLYFLSDEKINEGDWFLSNDNEILKCTKREDVFIWYERFTIPGVSKLAQPFSIHVNLKPKKIIATTDISIKLPQPSQDFIEVFIEKYNKDNVIEWVNVEYERYKERHGDGRQYLISERPKTNSKNEISIKKLKNSWKKTDLDLIKAFEDFACAVYDESYKKDMSFRKKAEMMSKQWIEKNL